MTIPPSPGTLGKKRRRNTTNTKLLFSLSSLQRQVAYAFQFLLKAISWEKYKLSKQQRPPTASLCSKKASRVPSGQRRRRRPVSTSPPARRLITYQLDLNPLRRGGVVWAEPRGPGGRGGGGDPGGSAPCGKDLGSGSKRLSL